MMTQNDQRATIDGEMFLQMRTDADYILQKLLSNMVGKNTNEGSLTIKIDVSLLPEFVPIPPEERTDDSGESRRILRPKFKHSISSTMQIKDDIKGASQTDVLELVYDSDTCSYILTPITGGKQMNIYDLQKKQEEEPEEAVDPEYREYDDEDEDLIDDGQKQITGRRFGLLPMNAPESDDEDEDEVIDAEYRESEASDDSDFSEAPEDFPDVHESSEDMMIDVPDDNEAYNEGDYEYEDPDEDEEI